jgi:hypothetical protein
MAFSQWLSPVKSPQKSPRAPGFPPQLCALALGSAGLARAWVLGGAAPALPQLWCLVSHGGMGDMGSMGAEIRRGDQAQ